MRFKMLDAIMIVTNVLQQERGALSHRNAPASCYFTNLARTLGRHYLQPPGDRIE